MAHTHEEATVATDDTTLGFSAETVVAFLGTRVETLTYADDVTTTGLTLAATLAGDPLLLSATPIDGATSCPDPSLRIPVDFTFVTTDGAFDLAFEEQIVLSEGWAQDSLHVEVYTPIADNVGSFTYPTAGELSLPLNYLPTSSIGEVIAMNQGGDEDPGFECGIAAWGAPLQTGCNE